MGGLPLVVLMVALVLVVLGAVLARSHRDAVAWEDALRTVAERGGLRLRSASLGSAASVEGAIDGIAVSISSIPQDGEAERVSTRWRLTDPLAPPAQITAEHSSRLLGESLLDADLTFGDPAFDDVVHVRGDAVELGARLDAPTRIALRKGVRIGWTLEDGAWTLLREGMITDLAEHRRAVDDGLALCRALQERGTAREQLVELAETDPVPGVRVRALRQRLGLGAVPDEILARLADGTDDLVALLCARQLRDHGRLVRALTNPSEGIRIQAALALAELPAQPVQGPVDPEAVLVEGLGVEPWVEDCVRALGARGSTRAVAPLRAHTTGLWPGPRKRLAARAIQTIQGRAVHAEAGLLSLVEEGGEAGGVSIAEERGAGQLSTAEALSRRGPRSS